MSRLALISSALLGLLFFSQVARADTTFVAGQVSGTWTPAGSPYLILADSEVPYGLSLIIEPGVEIKFVGHYKLILRGALTAVGTAQDSILFTHSIPVPANTWAGLRFVQTEGTSELAYCQIEWGHAIGVPGQPDARGGGVSVDSCAVDVHNCLITSNRADVKGGGIYLRYANSEIWDCTFSGNSCGSDGGGIFVEYCTDVSIHDNLFALNTADNGGGMHVVYSNGVIEDNHFEMNMANTMNGGGIYLDHSSPLIQRNYLIFNAAVGYNGAGILCANSSSPQILYNEICSNNAGIGCTNASSPMIDNNTIAQNGGHSITVYNNSRPFGRNNIIWANLMGILVGTGCSLYMTYSDVQGGWSGLGNINADPAFVGGNSYYLLPYSPCIDAGSPLAPLDPDSTIADMGAHYFDQNQPQGTCSITLTPFGSTTLPPTGGTISYGVCIVNTPNYFNLFDGWITLQQPDGRIIPLILRSNIYLPAAGIINRSLSITISASAMPGTYTVTGYVGENPSVIEDLDSFTFTKDSTDGQTGEGGTVMISGWGPTETFQLKSFLPQATHLLGHYPEPFNPQTMISFEVRDASRVKLEVYSINGRKVATLLDRQMAPGIYRETFDGSGLASGMYIYRLQAGEYSSSGKMVLLK